MDCIKLRTQISQQIMDLLYSIVDWLYYTNRSEYNRLPFNKDKLRQILDSISENKISNYVNKQIQKRDNC